MTRNMTRKKGGTLTKVKAPPHTKESNHHGSSSAPCCRLLKADPYGLHPFFLSSRTCKFTLCAYR